MVDVGVESEPCEAGEADPTGIVAPIYCAVAGTGRTAQPIDYFEAFFASLAQSLSVAA